MLKTKFCVKYCLDFVCKIKLFCYIKISIVFLVILRSWFKISRLILAGLFLWIKIWLILKANKPRFIFLEPGLTILMVFNKLTKIEKMPIFKKLILLSVVIL